MNRKKWPRHDHYHCDDDDKCDISSWMNVQAVRLKTHLSWVCKGLKQLTSHFLSLSHTEHIINYYFTVFHSMRTYLWCSTYLWEKYRLGCSWLPYASQFSHILASVVVLVVYRTRNTEDVGSNPTKGNWYFFSSSFFHYHTPNIINYYFSFSRLSLMSIN